MNYQPELFDKSVREKIPAGKGVSMPSSKELI
jgi:hypothetical protein